MRGIGPADYPRATNDVTLQPEFIRLHVLTKNLQSVRDQSRWEDLLVEFEVCDCDVGFFTETWRSKRQECFEMSSGGRLFLSGGGSRQGVGIGISARIVIGGDFNANVGSLQWSDEQDVVGEWGSGLRNARGATWISWILMNGLRIASRQSPTNNVDDSWTCQRTMDGARVQLDYILTDARACVDTIWHDQLIPIGLDHRCVHCLLRWRGVRPSLGNRRWNLKNWMPILDMDGGPSLFQNSLREMLDGNSFHAKCWNTVFLKVESNKAFMVRRLSHSNHPQCSGTSATAGAKVLILSGGRNCPSTSKNSIDNNFALGNPRNCRHAYAILHRGRCCGACSARLAMKLQINLMSMTLQKCWSICSMVTLLLP